MIDLALFALVALVMFVPCLALSFALLRGTGVRTVDKILFAGILSLIAVPLLSLLEFLVFGLKLNAMLVLANALLVLFASLAWLYYQDNGVFKNVFSTMVSSQEKITVESLSIFIKRYWPYLLLLIIMAFGFHVRFSTSWVSNFFEFDPYYYNKLTERIVQNGFLTTYSSDAYYPLQAFQRYAPLVQYLEASWMLLYNAIASAAYSKDNLILVAGLYPPLVGALLSFLAFLIVREEFGDVIALVPAFFFAATPQLVLKFSAGVSEQQPWGVFTSLLVLAVFALAVKSKSIRVGALAALSMAVAVLGSQQYIWPFMVISIYVLIQSVLDFLLSKIDRKTLEINALITVGGIGGNVVLSTYQEGIYTPLITSASILLASAFVGSAILYIMQEKVALKYSLKKKAGMLAALAVVGLLIMAATPLSDSTVGYVAGAIKFAKTESALGKTIAEEGASSEAMWRQSFGVLNPPFLLMLSALLSAAYLAVTFLSKGRNRLAAATAALVIVLIVFNNQLDAVLQAVAQASGSEVLISLVNFFAESDVFVYMLFAVFSVALNYLVSDEKNSMALLFVLVFFPIAFIGLNKLKYLLHLGFALALATGFVLGLAVLLVRKLNEVYRVAKDLDVLPNATLALLMLVVLVAGFAPTQGEAKSQLYYALDASAGLASNRLPLDWKATFDWMRGNLPKDARIMSWWDYGHWTTFLGERNTVLDPNNANAKFDHEVAQAFVDGDLNDLYYSMKEHKATHVMVDWELVNKWGALVFLSGSCDKTLALSCPETPGIPDWRLGPGRSAYETEHSFEFLSVAGNCPQSLSPQPMPALKSGFGPVYCATSTEMFLLTQTGLNSSIKRPFKILGRDNVTVVDNGMSYLLPFGGQGTFVNANPFLEPFGFKSKTINAAFVRLFFFESLPGFRKVYSSPNGGVKIFEYVGG